MGAGQVERGVFLMGRTIRGLCLTAKGRAAIGVPEPPVMVPLLSLVWLDEVERDKEDA